MEALTARETEVAALISQAYSDRRIASRLRISPRTVGTYLQRIYRKLELPGDNLRVALAIHQARQEA
jgi:DNA-binding CsgD family transcriptional regulator